MQTKPHLSRVQALPALGLLGILLVLNGCASKEEVETEPIIPVRVATVERSSIDRIVTTEGILFPLTQSAVMPKISSPVKEFYVERGDHVRKGQLLVLLENSDLTAASAENQGLYKQAEATYQSTLTASLPEETEKAKLDVQASKQALDAAEKLYSSRKELLAQGATAQRSVDEANVAYVQAKTQYDLAARHLELLEKFGFPTQVRNAEGQLEAAKGRSQGADAQLQYSKITSPIDGVVTDRSVYAGEMPSSGVPLVTIMDISRVIARAPVPVEQLKYIKIGNSATVNGSGNTPYPGKVTVISPAVQASSTTAEVWVTLNNPGERLRPGETVSVSIVAETIKDALVVPSTAILPGADGAVVLMTVGSDSVAHEKKIKIGIRGSELIQILEGADLGEKVIIEGGLGVEDNTKVRIEMADKNE